MFFLEITTDQIIFALASVIVTVSVAIAALSKAGWDWLKNQFTYLVSRIESLEVKMESERITLGKKLDEERLRLEEKLDEERDMQDRRMDGILQQLIQNGKQLHEGIR